MNYYFLGPKNELLLLLYIIYKVKCNAQNWLVSPSSKKKTISLVSLEIEGFSTPIAYVF